MHLFATQAWSAGTMLRIGRGEAKAARVEVFDFVRAIKLGGDVCWRGGALGRCAQEEHREVDEMGQGVAGRAVHDPASVAFESSGPVVAAEVALGARPASDDG